jgi:hypothetical protein
MPVLMSSAVIYVVWKANKFHEQGRTRTILTFLIRLNVIRKPSPVACQKVKKTTQDTISL